MLTIGSLFSGIGGLELGLEWAGLGPVVWQAEKDPFARSILEKHWPGVKRYEDVRDVDRGADLICGGFPCQDISSAGKGAGLAGGRSRLWFEFARIIDEQRPQWVIIENVASGAKRWVDQVAGHLGKLGYEAIPIPLSAQDVGAPHIRKRVFIVAYTNREQLRKQSGRGLRKEGRRAAQPGVNGQNGAARDANSKGESAEPINEKMAGVQGVAGFTPAWEAPPRVCRAGDGVPHRVDRLRCLGNAVVPQCAFVVGMLVREMELAE